MLVKIGKCHHDQSLPLNRFHFSMFGVCLVLILLTSPIMWNSLVSCSNDFCFSFFPPCDCDRRENIQKMCSFWVSKNPRDLSAKKKKNPGDLIKSTKLAKRKSFFQWKMTPIFLFLLLNGSYWCIARVPWLLNAVMSVWPYCKFPLKSTTIAIYHCVNGTRTQVKKQGCWAWCLML